MIIYCHEGSDNFKPAVNLLGLVMTSSQTPGPQVAQRLGEGVIVPLDRIRYSVSVFPPYQQFPAFTALCKSTAQLYVQP